MCISGRDQTNRIKFSLSVKRKITFLFFFLIIISVSAQKIFYNVLDYGAKGDGKTNNTKAINDAIDTAAKNGGGTVYFPAGDYLSFTIHMQSKITIYDIVRYFLSRN